MGRRRPRGFAPIQPRVAPRQVRAQVQVPPVPIQTPHPAALAPRPPSQRAKKKFRKNEKIESKLHQNR